MVAFILICAVVLPIIFCITGIVDLRRHRPTKYQLISYSVIAILFAVIGIYFSFFFKYFLNPTTQIVSFPLPAAAFQKYGDHWEDFVSPITFLIACWNVIVIFSLFPISLFIYRLFQRRMTTCS